MDQGYVSDVDAGTWTWFELVLLSNAHTKNPLIRDNVEYIWKSHFNPMATSEYPWVSISSNIWLDITMLFPHSHI